jgi:hypothetical protein
MTRTMIDTTLPTADGVTGAEAFTVEYRGGDKINGKCLYRVEHDTELAAVRCISAAEECVNLTLVGYGPNIDRSKYRY